MRLRRLAAVVAVSAAWIVFTPAAALADNCGSLSDCFGTLAAALAIIAAVAVVGALFLIALPYLGPGMGLSVMAGGGGALTLGGAIAVPAGAAILADIAIVSAAGAIASATVAMASAGGGGGGGGGSGRGSEPSGQGGGGSGLTNAELRLARQLRLNPNSSTTQTIIRNINGTLDDFVSNFLKASVRRELGDDVLSLSLREAIRNPTVRKIVTQLRFWK